MAKIKSLNELIQLRDEVKSKVVLREQGDAIENLTQIKVAMGTCGIASGARDIMNQIISILAQEGLDRVVVTQTDCMGYCSEEPTIEVNVPRKEAVVYGHVTKEKAKEIIEKHIKKGELVDGIIHVHKTVK